MAVDVTSYLANGETTLSEYRHGNLSFYATDRRLLVFAKGNFKDVAYKHITTMQYVSKKRSGLLFLGIVLFLGGGALSMFVGATGIVLLFFGIILMVLAFILKIRGYTIATAGGEKLEFPVKHQTDAESFLKIVREKMFDQKA